MPVTAERAVLDGTHRVLTPEYVEFDFVLAGLFSRFLAWLLDQVVVLLTWAVGMTALGLLLAAAPGLASVVGLVSWFLLDWGYAIALEAAWSGQTIGKRALGLRVIQESGVRVGLLHAALRNLARPIDRLPLLYLVGGSSALFSSSQQRLGDLLAGTIVVRERRLKIPSALARPDGEAHLLEDPAFRDRLARLSAAEEALVFAAATRRDELSLEARLSLFSALARRLQDEGGFLKPAHLSDEKLVLLVAAGLAARSRSTRRQPLRSRR